jgi:hypothetical protein
MPTFNPSGRKLEDFSFIEQEEPEKVLAIILDCSSSRLTAVSNWPEKSWAAPPELVFYKTQGQLSSSQDPQFF